MNLFAPQNLARITPRLLSSIPWITAILAGVLYIFIFAWFSDTLPVFGDILFWITTGLGFIFVGVVFYLTRNILRIIQERNHLKDQLIESKEINANANENLSTLLRFSEKLLETSEEGEIVEAMLQFSLDLSGAIGASYVPLDDHGHPLSAVCHGDFPLPVINSWIEYLASPTVRQECKTCNKTTINSGACPLLPSPFSEAIDLFCLPLRRTGQEYGVLNLYLGKDAEIDGSTQTLLRTVIEETALVLESNRFRKQALDSLSLMQSIRNNTDLNNLVSSILENVSTSLNADFAILKINNNDTGKPELSMTAGDFPKQMSSSLERICQNALDSEEDIVFQESLDGIHGIHESYSVMVAPVKLQDSPLDGVLAVGNKRNQNFNKLQLNLLQTTSAQIALVIQGTYFQAEVEFKAMMAERTRLAREIHDGLAQTLGFLKLQIVQMQNYLSQGDYVRLGSSLNTSLNVLTDVYQEARQAIDGLRISPSEVGLSSWLEQIVNEFQENSGLQVELVDLQSTIDLAPEIQAQLIRIVQEALSNVRKHANAKQVWISCSKIDADLILEVRDNGIGFSPDDIPGPSRYGLQIMHERSELIGADFQVISRPMDGAIVRVRLPILMKMKAI